MKKVISAFALSALVALVYLPMAAIGSFVWNWAYRPFLDAVDRGDPCAMAVSAVIVGIIVLYAWDTRERRW